MMKLATVVALGLACACCQPPGAKGVPLTSNTALVQLAADKAKEHNVPSSLAIALVTVESGWDAKTLSHGNYGLGQIRCGTAQSMGFKDNCQSLLIPSVNLEFSVRYLRAALDLAHDDPCKALMLYNRGIDKPIPQRATAYCLRVLKARDNN